MSTMKVNSIVNSAGTGAPDFPSGLTVAGSTPITTANIGNQSVTYATDSGYADYAVISGRATPSVGGVGSYTLAMHSTVYTGVISGTSYAGSILRQAGFITRTTNTSNGEYPTASASALSGTWMCLATNNVAPAYSSVQTYYASLFQRIS